MSPLKCLLPCDTFSDSVGEGGYISVGTLLCSLHLAGPYFHLALKTTRGHIEWVTWTVESLHEVTSTALPALSE